MPTVGLTPVTMVCLFNTTVTFMRLRAPCVTLFAVYMEHLGLTQFNKGHSFRDEKGNVAGCIRLRARAQKLFTTAVGNTRLLSGPRMSDPSRIVDCVDLSWRLGPGTGVILV